MPKLATGLDVSEKPQPADAIFIFPGSEDARPALAADLIQAGYAPLVMTPETSQSPTPPSVQGGASTLRTIKILTKRGVLPSQIVVLEGISTSTFTDIQALARYFEQNGPIDVIAVTNACHTRRARWVLQQVMPEHQSRVRFHAVPDSFDPQRWWTSRGGRNDVLTEWVKLLYYRLIHGYGWLWCVVLALACVTIAAVRHSANQCRAEEPKHVGVRNPQ